MLEALGNIGDFVGGLAVVITLVYLAVQIRQNNRQIEFNTRAVKAAAFQAQLDADRVTALEIVRNRDLASWLASSLDDLQTIEFADRIRLDTYLMGFLRSRQHEFINAEEGVIRRDLLASHEVTLRGLLSIPAGSDIWHRNKGQFIPDFVHYVDRVLQESSGSSSGA